MGDERRVADVGRCTVEGKSLEEEERYFERPFDDDDGSDEAVKMEGNVDGDDNCPDVGDGRIENELQPTPLTLFLI